VVKETEEETAENDQKQQEELQDGEEMETACDGEKVAADTNQIVEGDQVIQEETDESAVVQENHITEPQEVEGDSTETKEEPPKEERKRNIKVRDIDFKIICVNNLRILITVTLSQIA
jgi:hypothetical protein